MLSYYTRTDFMCPCGCKTENADHEFIVLVNRIANRAGFMCVLTSGCRCEAHNKEVGGKANSSHLIGLAADFAIDDNEKRYKWIKSAIECGVKRVGVGKTFVHIDVDRDKVARRLWLY